MNRLVIIGNGFDLAHGLPTSYGDFINWYWRELVSNIGLMDYPDWAKHFDHDDLEIHFNIKINQHHSHNTVRYVYEKLHEVNSLKMLRNFLRNIEIENEYQEYSLGDWNITFKNNFIEVISEKHSIQNWVDIENEYYRLLKDCLKENDNTKVKKLNREFEKVKDLLERYLQEEVIEQYDFKKPNKNIKNLLKHFTVDSKLKGEKKYFDEFPQEDQDELIEKEAHISSYKKSELQYKIWDGTIEEENMFVNFNYTHTVDELILQLYEQYAGKSYGMATQVQIHGRINDPDNKINFGFGDEMDDHYKQIEEKDDNEYLKYIKSFQYLQNSNYKRILDFIERKKFQVYIMGHSCGLSDRILLNTIFEHINCRSIKVFFHRKNNGSDNYTEIVQNISRHFNKKKMMRDKIVNKSLCVPLPQDIRFEKLNTP